MGANRLSRKRRARIKARRAKVEAIVSANLSAGKLERSPKGMGTSHVHATRLMGDTHTGVKTQLHEGSSVRVIAHKGFSLGKVEATGRMFGKTVPAKTFRTTGRKSKPFAFDEYPNDEPRRSR